MGEIDDRYQENIELIENSFFEKFKKGKKREKIIEEYHRDLDRIRLQYQKEYEKKLKVDKILASKFEKKKEEPEKYKHLEVEHLEFGVSGKEKFFSDLKLTWFRIDRWIKKNISQKVPARVLYLNYKILIAIKYFWRELNRIKDNFVYTTKKEIVTITVLIASFFKKVWDMSLKFFKTIFNKISFWRKKKEEKGEEIKEEKEKPVEEEKVNVEN